MWRHQPGSLLQGKMQFFDGQNRKISAEDTHLNFRIIKYTHWRTKNSGIREIKIRVYREPLTAGGHVTSLSRHLWGLRRAFSTWGGRFSRMSFTWKLLAYNSCIIPRNHTKILWIKSLFIHRGTFSGEMINLINSIGVWKQVPFMAADSKWRQWICKKNCCKHLQLFAAR